MFVPFRNAVVLGYLILGTVAARADETDWLCRQAGDREIAAPAPLESPEYRKYPPNRLVDVLHFALDVTPDFKGRTVSGIATFKFKPIARPLGELKFDGIELAVSNVTSSAKVGSWQATREQVIVTFDPPVPAGQETTLAITYRATPQQGLYFRTPEMGYRPDELQIWSQGEPNEARHWFPCLDYPNEKLTTEITCRVATNLTVLANGRQVSDTQENGLRVVRWLQDKAHANYLICLVAGRLEGLHDQYKNVPLAFWTPPPEFRYASNSFWPTKDIMAFFEQETGVPYPWAKYDQVVCVDFTMGGMENTTLTTLTEGTLHAADTESLRSSQSLIAHEMAHQWFGDLVTCKDWNHLWLNEGFATYYDLLYSEHAQGRDEYLWRLNSDFRQLYGVADQPRSVVTRRYGDPMEQFGWTAYTKGGVILHMLRTQLGPELYRQCIKTYLERNAYGNAITEDLLKVVEELSGRSFEQFFDQWLYQQRHPDLDVEYSWDDKAKLARISVKQTQTVSDTVPLFNFPLTIRFQSAAGTIEREVNVRLKSEDFSFNLPWQPEIVRINPELGVLAKINFKPPTTMLLAMLTNRTDMLGRVLAIEQLESRRDPDTIARFKGVLNSDPFYGVRMRAAQALRTIHSDEARDALFASAKQDDARVRQAVVSAINGFYGPTTREFALRVAREEKNPDIRVTAINALGTYPQPEVRSNLLALLDSQSFRQEVMIAAVNALRAQDDPAFLEPIKSTLLRREGELTSRQFGGALDDIAYLGRNQENKEALREFFTGYLNSQKRFIRTGAITALGALGDERVIPLLSTYTNATQRAGERSSAERAIAALRETRKPLPAEVTNLRRDVQDMQKENRKLREDLDALKKKVEAQPVTPRVKPSTNAVATVTSASPTAATPTRTDAPVPTPHQWLTPTPTKGAFRP